MQQNDYLEDGELRGGVEAQRGLVGRVRERLNVPRDGLCRKLRNIRTSQGSDTQRQQEAQERYQSRCRTDRRRFEATKVIWTAYSALKVQHSQ
jgi:hypothetical protein